MAKPTYQKLFDRLVKGPRFREVLNRYHDALARSGVVRMSFTNARHGDRKRVVVNPLFTLRLEFPSSIEKEFSVDVEEFAADPNGCLGVYLFDPGPLIDSAVLERWVDESWESLNPHGLSSRRFKEGDWQGCDTLYRRVESWIKRESGEQTEKARASVIRHIHGRFSDPGFPGLVRAASVKLAKEEISTALRRFEFLGDDVLREAAESYLISSVLDS